MARKPKRTNRSRRYRLIVEISDTKGHNSTAQMCSQLKGILSTGLREGEGRGAFQVGRFAAVEVRDYNRCMARKKVSLVEA